MKIPDQMHKLFQHLRRLKTPIKRCSHAPFRSLFIEQMEDRRMFATINLAALTAAQGSTIFGAERGDWSGWSVSSAGDVNRDGFDDMLIGARNADASGNAKDRAGDSYLIFGSAVPPSWINLANLGTLGMTISGADFREYSGHSVSGAGDINGDGFDDLLIGLNSFSGRAGYVIFGRAVLPATIDLATLGTAGITIFGVDGGDYAGSSVSSAGDVNGDGFDDLLIGARGANASGNAKTWAGETYLIFGRASLPSTINLATLGTTGVTIFGADAYDLSGWSVSGAGDVNGDGFDDVLIGAFQADASSNSRPSAGESYVIFGGATLPARIDLASLGRAGVTIFGAELSDGSGRSVSGAGDVNGDGFDDLIIGASSASAFDNAKGRAGESYVVFGRASLPTAIDLAALGTLGTTIFGANRFDYSGFSVSNAGDVNGDGFDDLVIGAYGAGAPGSLAGDSYLIFGRAALPTTIDLANLGTLGVIIRGAESNDRSGRAVSSAGDVNGDGFDDLLIGAYNADAAGNAQYGAGDSYVVFGRNFTAAVTQPGTAASETLTGSSASNVIIGGRGNDTLLGLGGADVLIGGQGNDVLAINDLTFKRVVGGTGTDILRLVGSGLSLNLTTIRDNRLLGIEQIDITGNGKNTLTLNQREVLNLSNESNTLVVRRDAGDAVNILDLNLWRQTANENLGSDTFRVYTQGAATLKVLAIVNTPPVGVPTISGRGREDDVLTAVTTSIDDADGLGPFNYQWQRANDATFTTGVVQVGSNSMFYRLGDADVDRFVRVSVTYTDGDAKLEGPLTSSSIGPIVNVNDAPTNITLSKSTIAENAGANAVVGTLAGVDPDAGSTLTFSLPVGLNNNSLFNVSGNSLRANASFNFEALSTYVVTVRVSDGALTLDKSFTIGVTNVNEAPTNITLSNSSVVENAGANAVVGTLAGVDPDAVSSLTFSLPVGLNSNSLFNVSGNSLRANASFDFETLASYLITVRASDGSLTFDKQLTVGIVNMNDPPSILASTPQSVAGNTPLIFSTTKANAISVADVDAGVAPVQLTLTATNGLMTLPSIAELTFTSGANGQTTFTVQGTLAALNAALNGLRFQPNLNFTGAASIAITVNDLGNTGLGGALSTTRSIAITVVGQSSIVDNTDPGYVESGTWSASALPGINGSTTRFSSSAGAVATWNTPTLVPGFYSVAIWKVVNATSSTNARVTIVHNGITEPVQTINLTTGTSGFVELGTFFFSGAPGEFVRLSQGATVGTLRADSVRFNRLPPVANTAPLITAPTTQSAAGNTPLIFSTTNANAISVADVDAGVAPLQLTLTATNGLMTLPSTAGLTLTTGANGQATFTVQGTLAALNAALNGLRFKPNLNFTGAASIAITVNDLGNSGLGGPLSTTRSIAITVASSTFIVDNNAPGYVESGTWSASGITGINGSSTRFSSAANAAATWNAPTLLPGFYSVAIWKVVNESSSTNASVTIVHNGITEPVQTINLTTGTSGFVELGTFFFSGAPGEFVRLSHGATVGTLRADSVRFNKLP
jgi:hypothetical protein